MGNNISFKGIEYLVRAEFCNNLIILNLCANKQIGDLGIRIMKEIKIWSKLNTLFLNSTGLTDEALKYLEEARMPRIKKLKIMGNKFIDAGKPSINILRINHMHVSYRAQAEREKEKEKEEMKKENEKEKKRKEREKEKEKEEIQNKENNRNKIQEKHKDLGDDYYLLTKFKNNTLNKYLNYLKKFEHLIFFFLGD